mmetsp:Transcript_10567/g.27150  ORF Transcript_10567/g.27150 Transcript_10567/m.27150 type:complete len:938 (-) Transcript_10567:119-2932(-)
MRGTVGLVTLAAAALCGIGRAHLHHESITRRELTDGVERCIQDDQPTDEDILHRVAEVQQFRSGFQARVGGLSKLRIKTIFHVIHAGGTGRVTQDRIDAQIEVLNAGFGGATTGASSEHNTGLRFALEEVNYIDNSDWYYNCKASSYIFRPAHVRDSTQYFNVFTCSGDGYLGWTWLPWTHGEGSNMQAVIVNENSLPGGSFSKYSLGYTLVHESGHYFGLLHTFARGVCTGVGDDGVDDTPLEARGASSCGASFDDFSRDTCPDDPGTDPLWSFMDYSYDQCMQRFSPGQVARMRQMTDLHRPQLAQNSFDGWVEDDGPTTEAPTAAPSAAPTSAPTTANPTVAPSTAPTATPSLASTVAIVAQPVSMAQGETVTVTLDYTFSTINPLVVKVEIVNSNGLWVGGSTITPLPRVALRTGSGSIVLPCTLHGKPLPASDYKILAWLMYERDLDAAAPWTKRVATDEATAKLTVTADGTTGGTADPTGSDSHSSVCNTYGSASVNWNVRSGAAGAVGAVSAANVCAGSKNLDSSCFGEESYVEATETCSGIGARLCTAEELFQGVAKDTGCNSNTKYHWSSSACGTGMLILAANPNVAGMTPQCVQPTATAAADHKITTVCCADNLAAPTPAPTAAPVPAPTDSEVSADCLDRVSSDSCARWEAAGFCGETSLYYNYMTLNCRGTCAMCTTTTPEPEMCVADIKQSCTVGAASSKCCAGIGVCTVWGTSGKLKCMAPNPPATSLYPVGERCVTHAQCDTGYCDKKGNYGLRFRCYAASSKSEETDGDGAAGSNMGDNTVVAVVAAVGGIVVAAAALATYHKARQASDTLPTASTETSSVVTGTTMPRHNRLRIIDGSSSVLGVPMGGPPRGLTLTPGSALQLQLEYDDNATTELMTEEVPLAAGPLALHVEPHCGLDTASAPGDGEASVTCVSEQSSTI